VTSLRADGAPAWDALFPRVIVPIDWSGCREQDGPLCRRDVIPQSCKRPLAVVPGPCFIQEDTEECPYFMRRGADNVCMKDL